MTAEVEAAKQFAFSLNDLLTGLAVLLSAFAVYVSHFKRWTTLVIKTNLSAESFKVQGTPLVSPEGAIVKEWDLRCSIKYDVLVFATGNASAFVELIGLFHSDNKNRGQWSKSRIFQEVSRDTVSVFPVEMKSTATYEGPVLSANNKDGGEHLLYLGATIYMPNGKRNEIRIPVVVRISTSLAIESVEHDSFTLEYSSPVLPPGIKEFFTGK